MFNYELRIRLWRCCLNRFLGFARNDNELAGMTVECVRNGIMSVRDNNTTNGYMKVVWV